MGTFCRTKSSRVIGGFLLLLLAVASGAHAQSWVETRQGPGGGDAGPRLDAIVLRQILNIAASPTRMKDGHLLTYNHPSNMCETDKGTLIMAWNGGKAEGQGSNRAYFMRKEAGWSEWSAPALLEPDRQIDFGVVYQPRRRPGAPIIAGYWLGTPTKSACAMRFSTDDGKTWSAMKPLPKCADGFYDSIDGRFRMDMNHPLELPDGALWFATCRKVPKPYYPAITVVPPDNYTGEMPAGTAWKNIAVKANTDKSHPSWLVLSPDYKKLAIIGRQHGGVHAMCVTQDGGQTWSDWVDMPKECGERGVASVSLDIEGGPAQGWHVVAGKLNAPTDKNIVAISRTPTDMKSWKPVLILCPTAGENSDPSLFQGRDRKIHLLFTGRGSCWLKYYVLDPDKLVSDSPPAKINRTWPGDPSNLKGTPAGPGRLDLTWTDNADNETGIRVQRRMVQESAVTETIEVPGANLTSYTDTGVKPGKYTYVIQAFNAEGGSAWTDPITVQVPGGAP